MNTIAESLSLSHSAEMERDHSMRHVAIAIENVNEAIMRAVDAGVSVELALNCRYHDGRGNWGDQMTTLFREYTANKNIPPALSPQHPQL